MDFISILPHTPKAQESVDTLFRRALVDRKMLYHFISLGDKYLYEPNSPMHDEDLYILFLRALVNHPGLEETDRIRPRHLLEMALKNRRETWRRISPLFAATAAADGFPT